VNFGDNGENELNLKIYSNLSRIIISFNTNILTEVPASQAAHSHA
jgi:hypothetical protein